MQTRFPRGLLLLELIFRQLRGLRENFGTGGDAERNILRCLPANVTDLHGLADGRLRNGIHEIGAGVHGRSVDVGDHVAGLQAGFISGAAGFDCFHHDSVGRAELLEQHGIVATLVLKSDANGAAGDFAVGDELVVNVDDRVGGHGEADAFERTAFGVNGGVDADYFAGHIDERAAGVSGVDGGVSLNETLKLVADVGTVFGADDSGRNGGVQSKGAAEGKNPVADLHAIGITKPGDREFMVRVNLNYRDICVFVDANYMGAVMRRIAVDGDLNFGGLVNHVVVGEDETFFVNDDSGAKASLGIFAAIGRIKKAVEEILEVALRVRLLAALGLLDYLRGGDVYDRGANLFRDGREPIGERNRVGDN